jgi:REP element-mobilizing transposase RayT
MNLQPYYSPQDVNCAYHLRYNWAGWPSSSHLPPEPERQFFENLAEALEPDGIRILEHRWSSSAVQIVTSVRPCVSPTFFTARMKGRLNYALRHQGTPVKFKRNFAMKTLGENSRPTVERYIREQVDKAEFADPRFADMLERFTLEDDTVDLSKATCTKRGLYWYNLHLVLSTHPGLTIVDEASLRTIFDGCRRIARSKGHKISRLAIMPDHLHCSLRGHIDHSPGEIALGFMNNLAYLLGHEAIWRPSYYVGSFGDYDMGAVRSGSGMASHCSGSGMASHP